MTQPTLFDAPTPTPAPSTVAVEKTRAVSNARKLLAYLREHASATNRELAEVAGQRFGGRILELRKDGWLIDTEIVAPGLYRYTFRGMKPL